jgi:hypothetical protein
LRDVCGCRSYIKSGCRLLYPSCLAHYKEIVRVLLRSGEAEFSILPEGRKMSAGLRQFEIHPTKVEGGRDYVVR